MSSGDGATDFEIANKVSLLIKGIAKDRQHKILRWVAESLDMPLATAPSAPSGMGPQDTTTRPSGQISGRSLDIKSFVEAKNPRSDMQFAAVVAYYYRFEAPVDQRLENISAEILQDAARLASRARLKRPLTTLNNAKGQGYLDTVGRGQFRINSVGENLVAMALPSTEPAEGSARTRAGKKKSGRKKGSSRGSNRGHPKKVGPRAARR